MKQTDTSLEQQRMWARWYTRARKAYEEECRRRSVKDIDWRELPLIPLPKKEGRK